MDREELKQVIRQIIEDITAASYPHRNFQSTYTLSQADYDILFPREPITVKKELKAARWL